MIKFQKDGSVVVIYGKYYDIDKLLKDETFRQLDDNFTYVGLIDNNEDFCLNNETIRSRNFLEY